MKKIICVMAIMLFGISGLVACGKSDSKYTGRWKKLVRMVQIIR